MRVLLLFIFVAFSCKHQPIPEYVNIALNKAGDNRSELEVVINHYQENAEKLQATYFLIGNMQGKGTMLYELVDGEGKLVNFNMADFQFQEDETKWLDSVKVVRGSLKERETFLPDLENITSEFLINNIDRAFHVKEQSPFCRGISDADFYEYILPYRVDYEKLEPWRDLILNTLTEQQKDSIYSFSNVLAATNFIDNMLQKNFDFGGSRYYKQKKVRCYSELMSDKVGKCDDMCNLIVMVLRTVGIPVALDGISYRRASDSNGHGWCVIIDPKHDKNYPFDALADNGPGLFELPDDNPPKVLRKQFAVISNNSIKSNVEVIHPNFYKQNSLDVTSEYLETVNISIPLDSLDALVPVYLNIWHRGEWKPIDYSYNQGSLDAKFSQIAKNQLYCISRYNNFENKEISEPFIVNRFGDIEYGSSLGVHKKIDLNNFKTRYLDNAKNGDVIYTFGRDRNFKKVSVKAVEKEIQKNEWLPLSITVDTNRFYFLSDSRQSKGRVFVISEDEKSINWY